MTLFRSAFIFFIAQFFLASTVIAGDFDWLKNLDISAKADLPGFNTTLASRFRIGDAEIKAVINHVERPSDAYMVLRLGEISHQPTNYVVKQYRKNKHKGWGALAKSLGIKPGSREFHELKARHDLHMNREGHHRKEKHEHDKSGNDHGNSGKHKSHGKNK